MITARYNMRNVWIVSHSKQYHLGDCPAGVPVFKGTWEECENYKSKQDPAFLRNLMTIHVDEWEKV